MKEGRYQASAHRRTRVSGVRASAARMPGPIHDGLLTLLLNSGPLAFELAARCGARLHGGHEELRCSAEVFPDPGAQGRQFIADAVIVAWGNVDGELTEVDAVVLEIQVHHDELKLISWVVYRAGVRSRHRCRGWTLMLAVLTEEQMAEVTRQSPPEEEYQLSKLELGSYAYSRGLREGRETKRPAHVSNSARISTS
jgi:hypothetical protein